MGNYCLTYADFFIRMMKLLENIVVMFAQYCEYNELKTIFQFLGI